MTCIHIGELRRHANDELRNDLLEAIEERDALRMEVDELRAEIEGLKAELARKESEHSLQSLEPNHFRPLL